MYYWNICDSSAPGEAGGVYTLPYGEAVDGKRHGFQVSKHRGVEWTRNPDHKPDPKCPECSAPPAPRPEPEPEPKGPRVHVPPENLDRYRRLMALVHKVDRIGNTRSNRGDYAGANRAWSRASAIKQTAQTLRVRGRAGR